MLDVPAFHLVKSLGDEEEVLVGYCSVTQLGMFQVEGPERLSRPTMRPWFIYGSGVGRAELATQDVDA